MIAINECRIQNVRKNKYQSLLLTLEIKNEDYDRLQEELIFNYSSDGMSLAVVMNPFGEKPEVDEGALRSKLAGMMSTYCEKQGLNMEEELAAFYKREGITSRSQLTGSKLTSALENYRAGLTYGE